MKKIGNFLKSIFSRITQKMGSLFVRNRARQNSVDDDFDWLTRLAHEPKILEIFFERLSFFFDIILFIFRGRKRSVLFFLFDSLLGRLASLEKLYGTG